MNLQTLLDELLAEPLAAAERRAAQAFDQIAAPFENRVLVFGCGYLGKLALSGLRAAGVEPLAFCDNNLRLWGSQVEGLAVLSPAEAAARYKHSAAFVCGIYNSTLPQNQLRQLGCLRVIPYPLLFWKYWRFMPAEDRLELPHRLLARAGEMAAGYDLLADDRSRHEFCAQIRWRCLLDYTCLPKADDAREMYYPPDLMRLIPDEVFVDCGAFDGDTIRSFLDRAGGCFGHIYAIEADPHNLRSLNGYLSGLAPAVADRITVFPYAIGKTDGAVRFSAQGFAGSKIGETGASQEVPCRRLDGLLDGTSPTLIKMDIEGAELDALAGGGDTIARSRSLMAVCAYHKCDHLWIIPQLIKAANPDYRIFFRRYAEDCWETVYYAVPPERLLG
jgi:FkbM family methyltransferase